MSVHVNMCLRGSHPYLSYILNLIFFVLSVFCLCVAPTPSSPHSPFFFKHPGVHSQHPPVRHTSTPPSHVCTVYISRVVAMPTAHFLCLSCGGIWSKPTLPPTGHCRLLQALQSLPYQPLKGWMTKKALAPKYLSLFCHLPKLILLSGKFKRIGVIYYFNVECNLEK